MKKRCPQCETAFYGRTDKLFCSVACKNQFHNQQRKSDITHSVDHVLHTNRSILQKLISEDSPQAIWDRGVLLKLGFDFQVFTGIMPKADGKFMYRVYEYAWREEPADLIIMERVSMEFA